MTKLPTTSLDESIKTSPAIDTDETSLLDALSQLVQQTKPLNEKTREFKLQVDRLSWCRDEECLVPECIEDSVKFLATQGLALKTVIQRKAGCEITVIGHIYAKANKCGHYAGEGGKQSVTILQMISDAAKKFEVSLEAGQATAGHLRQCPEVYYNTFVKDFWVITPADVYIPVGVELLRTKLNEHGFSPLKGDDRSNSEIDRTILRIVENHHVASAGQFSGYSTGLHHVQNNTILATNSYRKIESIHPKDSAYTGCPHLWAALEGMLGDQVWRFLAWLRSARTDLEKGRRSGGLCLIVVGDPDIGKSLVLKMVITPVLGGRVGNAASYMSKGSEFNDTLIGSEVWAIDDGDPFADFEARKTFSNMVKTAVAAPDIFCHGKGRPGFTLPLYRRLVVICNEDALESAPEITGSMKDKVLLLRASRFVMPEGCLPLPPRDATSGWEEFEAMITSELPSFLGWLEESKDVDKYAGGRFGAVAWSNPELTRAMDEASPIHMIATIIWRSCLESVDEGNSVELQAKDIYLRCTTGKLKAHAMKLLKNPRSVGVWLHRMLEHETFEAALTHRTKDGLSRYTITWTADMIKRLSDGGRSRYEFPEV